MSHDASDYFCISATFPDARFHGRGDGGQPEWPPSPMRLFQAIVAANAERIGTDGKLERALQWLEGQGPPTIVAPPFEVGSSYCLSVPNNAMDIVGRAWSKGNYFGSGDANPATHRTMKTVTPVRMVEGDTVYYLWPLNDPRNGDADVISPLCHAAGRLVALGWGIDLVVGRGVRMTSQPAGERWDPTPSAAVANLRTPVTGTLAALQDRHDSFLNRIGNSGFVPVEPLNRFKVTGYRRATDFAPRPHAIFELKHDDDSYCAYPQRKLIHIAGMLRHLAKEAMQKSPPAGVDAGWVERYVVGHRDENAEEHRQLSYLPLPSIGHRYADQAIRRVMIAAPLGDDGWLEHLARRLDGQRLKPKRGDEFGDRGPPTLMRIGHDKVSDRYTAAANAWATVTPVILPGHNDGKTAKTRKLIVKALAQSGIEQPCEIDWSAVSRFPNSLSAHKYDRAGQRTGYFRPDHLLSQTLVHLTVRFKNGLKPPGPLVIGAGRHCGLGLFAADGS